MTQQDLERKARFKTVIQALNIGRQAIARDLGYKKRYLDQILSADKNVSDALILKFTRRHTKVNPDWLLTGTGEMFLISTGVDKVEENPPPYLRNGSGLLESLIRRVEELERWREDMEKQQTD